MTRGAEHTPYLSVVIPCYNEQGNLELGILDEILAYLTSQGLPWEVIIVDDGSTDSSRQLISRFVANHRGFQLLDTEHGGKPAAIWKGIQIATGEILVLSDMDLSTPIEELEKLLPWLDRGFDMIIGSRIMTRRGLPVLRRMCSRVFRSLRRLVILSEISDTQCGFKICRRSAAMKVFPRLQFLKSTKQPKGWKVSAYDVELLYLFQKMQHAIKEVNVQWSHRDRSITKGAGSTGELFRFLRESVEMAAEVATIKLNQLEGMYDDA